jgi:class 3 adenylate cyclase
MPSFSSDAAFCEWWFRYRLFSEAAGHAIASARKYKHTDVRPILSSIHVPVLVLHRPDHVEPSWSRSARYLADHIAGASIRELPGSDSMIWTGDPSHVHAAVDDFLDELHREQVELDRVLTTVMFTDIVGATEKAAELGDHGWRDLAQRHHTAVRALIGRYRGVEVDTAGDGFFATFDGPARAIRCAQAIAREVRPLGIEVRAGIHTGEVETINGKAGGMTVHIGARIGAIADRSEILVSRTVIDLVAGAGLQFADRGEHQLKGIPVPWRIYQVLDRHADGA